MIELDYDVILKEIEDKFTVSELPASGANWILPNGKFLDVPTHGTVDEFVFTTYELDIEEYIDTFGTSIMSTVYNCVRINDGATMSGDFYVQLPPKNLTSAQYYSLEDWLDQVDKRLIDVSTSDDQFSNYDLSEVVSDYIIKRIKRYYTSGTLYENHCMSTEKLKKRLRESLEKH